MEHILTNFVRALRTAGATVSAAESIDAARAMAVVGYEDRQALKDSLGIVLAKTPEEKEVHDKLFEMYFSRMPETPPQSQQADQEQAQDGESSAGGEPGGGNGEGQDPADALLDMVRAGDASRTAMAMERAAAAVGVDDIRFASQSAYYVRRMLQQMGIEAMEDRLLEKLRDNSAQAQAQAQEMIDARSTLTRQARAYVDQRYEVFGRNATEAFMDDVVMNRSIEELGPRDMERMKAVVAKMAKRLAVKHSRRRRVRNRGQLDIRRTMRANAANDGVPFELVWKRKKTDRPKIVAICDVSGSVAQYVRFLLLFLYALREGVADLEAFAFSARLHDVGDDLKGFDADAAMRRIVDRVGGGSTDYGQALDDLIQEHAQVIDRRTTVLMLGDGRSNYGDPRMDIFEEIADRAKRVVWLCPEPPGRWGSGDSEMLRYRTFCTHLVHCATAADLEVAMDEILTAYG